MLPFFRRTLSQRFREFSHPQKSAFVSFGPPSFPSWFWDSSKAFHGFYFHHLGICFFGDFLRILAWDSAPLHHHLGKLDFFPTTLSKSKSLWPRRSFQWIFCSGFVTWIFWGRPPHWIWIPPCAWKKSTRFLPNGGENWRFTMLESVKKSQPKKKQIYTPEI